MPFKETCVEDEKLRFIAECLKGETTMSERCEAFGISREWGYELVRRYRCDGPSGLRPRSRAPHRCGQAMSEAVALAIMALRRERPYWGPKKLRAVLAQRHPEIGWPAASTIGDLLRREGLSEPRRRRRRAQPLTRPFAPVCRPNDLWCIDFKGWFRTADGRRCDPLTISDAESRFLIECRIVAPTAEGVRPVVDAALREHGLPLAIRSDNGPPFASTGAGGLTALAIHWIKLGIRLERILPGQPQQNGRHERMHGTLKGRRCARRRAILRRSRIASTASGMTSMPTGPMRRSARRRRGAATSPSCRGRTRTELRNQATTPIMRCAVCAVTARSSGAASWFTSEKP